MIFIFDGKIPALKRQTISKRRLGLEREEMRFQELAKKQALNQIHGFNFGIKKLKQAEEFEAKNKALDEKINKYLQERADLEEEKESMRIQAELFLQNFNEEDFENFTPELQNSILIALKNHRYEMVHDVEENVTPQDFSTMQLYSYLEYVNMKDKVTKKVLHENQNGTKVTHGKFVSDPQKKFMLLEGKNVMERMNRSQEIVHIDDEKEEEDVFESLDDDENVEIELNDQQAENLLSLFGEPQNMGEEAPIEMSSDDDEIQVIQSKKRELENSEGNVNKISRVEISHDDFEVQEILDDVDHEDRWEEIPMQEEKDEILEPYAEIISLESEPEPKPPKYAPQPTQKTNVESIVSPLPEKHPVSKINEIPPQVVVPLGIIPTNPDKQPIEQPSETSLPESLSNPMEEFDDVTLDQIFEEDFELNEDVAKSRKRAAHVTRSLIEQTKELLDLLGIPHITAPYEADAQCAYYNLIGAVDTVITEDSDVFLFGATSICSNIFSRDEKDHPEIYTMKNIENTLQLDRSKLIQLGYLLGGDYTDGVRNCGIVNAMECVVHFDNNENELEKNIWTSLTNFANWVRDLSPPEKGSFEEKHFKQKVKFVLPTDFPDDRIMNAYLSPIVKQDVPDFKWGELNMDKLYQFAQDYMSLSPQETDQILKPALENRNNSQTNIQSFFMESTVGNVKSKRLLKAIEKLKKPRDSKE